MAYQQYELETIKTVAKGQAVTDTDAALQLIYSGIPDMTPEDEKRLVRKIDLAIVPLMCSSPICPTRYSINDTFAQLPVTSSNTLTRR